MKKNLIALAVLAASGAAFAQSNVTLWGVADIWFGNVKSNGVSTTKLDGGGVSHNRFGFKGSEDLGGGLKANFALEQGFTLDTGAADNAAQAFARQSYVGFSSAAWGEVRLGKTFSPFDDIQGLTNFAFDSALSPQYYTWKSVNYQDRPSNTFYYGAPTMGGFTGALSYSLGENKNTPLPGDASSVTSFNVQYAGGPIYAGLAYQTEKGQGNGAATDKFTRLNGSYDLGVAKLLGGYGRVTSSGGATTNDWSIGADYLVSKALTVSGGFARSTDNAAAGDFKRDGYSLAASYSMSKRTSVYGGYMSAKQKKTGTADVETRLLAVGVRHAF